MNNKDRYTEKRKKLLEPTLKACPFCGCQPELERTHTSYWWVECPNCYGQSGSTFGARRAVDRWNQRANFTLR